MKILLVTHENPGNIVGGLGTFIRSYAAALRTRAEVRVLFIRYGAGEQVVPGSLVDYVVDAQYSFPAHSQEGKVVDTAFDLSWKIGPILAEFQPDIIHCNDRQTYLPFKCLQKVVFSLHLSVPDLLGPAAWDECLLTEAKIERLALERASATIVYSRFMAGRVRKTISKHGNLYCLPLGSDQDFRPRQLSKQSLGGKPLVVSFFGRLEDRQKGIREYVEACARIPSVLIRETPLEFRVYGRGDPWDWSPSPAVYKGFVEGEERKSAFEESDIVVFPSRYEPFGLVGLEAIASGALLLATPGLGMDEYFRPGANGVAIRPQAGDIAEKLESVVRNWAFYSRLRVSARDTVKDFTWAQSVEAHMAVYDHVIKAAP